MPRILNFSFHHLNSAELDILKTLPCCSTVHFEGVRLMSYLPYVSYKFDSKKVLSICKHAVKDANPQKGDITIVAGGADVVVYMIYLLSSIGVTILCPVATMECGKFRIHGFRQIVEPWKLNEEIPVIDDPMNNGREHVDCTEGSHLREKGMQTL